MTASEPSPAARATRARVTPRPKISSVPFGDWPTRELGLTSRDREALRSIAAFQRLPARTSLFEQGRPATHIYNVLAGCVYSERRLANGARRGVAILLSGDLSGLAAHGLYVNSARTVVDTDVLKFPLPELKAMLLGNSSLQMIFLCKAAHAIRESERQILLLSHKDPVERLAFLISRLRSAGHTGVNATVPWSEREFASFLDLAPGRLARAVETLVSAGVVRRGHQALTVVSPARLRRLIQRPPWTADPAPQDTVPGPDGLTPRRRPTKKA
jgi:CRP/FNR family transcriptional regulator